MDDEQRDIWLKRYIAEIKVLKNKINELKTDASLAKAKRGGIAKELTIRLEEIERLNKP